MNNNISSMVDEELNKYLSLDEEEQVEFKAKHIMQLIDILPDYSNEKEFGEFLDALSNVNIEGETLEEITQSFLNLSKTNQTLFAQLIAMSALINDSVTFGEIAKELSTQKEEKVEKVSLDEINKLKEQDEKKKIADFRKLLDEISIE